ncbi:MAG: AAA family ATPase [Actinomycetota bacterium]
MGTIGDNVDAIAEQRIDLGLEQQSAGIDEFLVDLDARLVGLLPVKSRIAEIASLLLVERVRERLGLAASPPTLHMSFTGNPGTGKTTVATTMAEILHRLGYLPTSRLLCVSRDDLVGEYIGHTGPKTREVLKRVAGGVLFIDEAYSLHRPENERDYGQEAIEILLQVMEDQHNATVVILAGYADRMDRFFSSNPGFRSRVGHHIEFPDYTDEELVEIAEAFLAEQNYRFSPQALSLMRQYVHLRRQQPHFANARSVRNALDRARLRHAHRQVNAGIVTLNDLTTIDDIDISPSRVFATPADE